MRSEILKVLEDVDDFNLISQILSNMDNNDISKLMTMLSFTDTETQDKWLDTYSKLYK